MQIENARLIPREVRALLGLGGILVGSAASPNRSFKDDMPRDWDILVPPKCSQDISYYLASMGTPTRVTSFGGFEFTVKQDIKIDVFFSTLEEFLLKTPINGEQWIYSGIAQRYFKVQG
jgi:hypothetical protein